jgi:hypothetical protein
MFACPFCHRVVEDSGTYAETACSHEFEVVQTAVFFAPVNQATVREKKAA